MPVPYAGPLEAVYRVPQDDLLKALERLVE
ncbi:MAG: hypothetical protein KatS3mg131_0980 [Candidatus Tectimicrobiota bacterium]|nr:MAG: hypothetical protein KatS3mg131_0980 [Candidatus Tectomicrobia bacterium]